MGDREINDKWAGWLRRKMRQTGHDTPTKLGHASGVDQSVISRWLNEGRTPQVDQLRKISAPLGASMLDLLVAAGYVSPEEVGAVVLTTNYDATVEEAIRRDTDLMERARQHLLDQYEMLRDLSVAAGSKDDTRASTSPAQRPLRAVARKRPPRTP